ncbi:hypothetical protein ACF3NA_03765 [Alkanindiges sp. WGS2144]|uniref:hypothetical protein n=1 Tax=Alkanindiges sp. WGS2144 TaxID=3366808 RepID=UPI003752992C
MKANANYQDASHTMSLLTTTTGFVDVYMIEAHDQLPWLIPQNLVLAALSAPATSHEIEWRDLHLPVLSLVDTQQENPVALVLEGFNQYRFALLTARMPEAQRVRISSLHDEDQEPGDKRFNFQTVRMAEQLYQVPDFEKIQQHLTSK